jgi:hypothetical protein
MLRTSCCIELSLIFLVLHYVTPHTVISFLFRFVENRTEQSYFQFFLYAVKCYITSSYMQFSLCVHITKYTTKII